MRAIALPMGCRIDGADPIDSPRRAWSRTCTSAPNAARGLVHPVDWGAVDAVHWRVELRCPECEHRSVGLYEQAVVDRFDQILDAGTDSLYADLRRLERTNMEAELRRFSAAPRRRPGPSRGLLTPTYPQSSGPEGRESRRVI